MNVTKETEHKIGWLRQEKKTRLNIHLKNIKITTADILTHRRIYLIIKLRSKCINSPVLSPVM